MLAVKTKLSSRWPAKLHGDTDKGPRVNFTTQTEADGRAARCAVGLTGNITEA